MDVINLDAIYDLRDTDRDGSPLRPGHRRDHLTGTIYYSSRWLSVAPASVGELPGPDADLVEEASRCASHEPSDPEGARVVKLQALTAPADGNIGPHRTMLGLVPKPEDRVRHSAALFVDSLRSAGRCAERLASVAGVSGPITDAATDSASSLLRMADRVERDVEFQLRMRSRA